MFIPNVMYFKCIVDCQLCLLSIYVREVPGTERAITHRQLSLCEFYVVLIILLKVCIRDYSFTYIFEFDSRALLWAESLAVKESHIIRDKQWALGCSADNSLVMGPQIVDFWSIL